MDFFREQEIARRNSRLLTLLFVGAVLVLIALTNLLVSGLFVLQDTTTGAHTNNITRQQWSVFLAVGAVIAGVVACVALFNWLRFARGGHHVAEALGGRLAVSNSNDILEQRAQNIVAEMALAANMPVPPLYILDQERGINAFAAGVNPGNAVVAVTRGALERLNRDELQGVIGHEFSHILNGDMRLSVRLAAMLRGITFIGDIGSVLLHSVSYGGHRRRNQKNDSTAALLVLGLGLYLLGLLGGLLAGLIKSAISKQKEFLADASAVQFTRNPNGIANALKVIGGYTPGTLVHSARAEELSHLFFGQVKHRLWSLFATHPPLETRIRRIDPSWDGAFLDRPSVVDAPASQLDSPMPNVSGIQGEAAPQLPPIDLDSAAPQVDKMGSSASMTTLPTVVLSETKEPLGAVALILGLLWREPVAQHLNTILAKGHLPGLDQLVAQRGRELHKLDAALRLVLVELCLPTLKSLSYEQYRHFKDLLLQFIRADGRVDLQEWCLYQLVRHYLDPAFGPARTSKPRFRTLAKVTSDLEVAFGTLAMLSHGDTEAAFARGATSLQLPLILPAKETLGVQAFGKAIDTLADCYPLLKVTLLKAMAEVASADGSISADELTLIKAIAAVIDCPVPDAMLPIEQRQPTKIHQ